MRHRFALRLLIITFLAIFLLFSNTSAATSETINYTEDFVDATSNLHDPANKGTNSSFTAMQAFDQTNNTLTEENTGGGGSSEWLSVNAFDSTWDTFDITVGNSPWLSLQDQPDHYRGELASAGAQLGWFDFPATTLTGTLAVNISCYTDSYDGDDWLDVWVDYTGSGAGADVGDVGLHIGWQYDTISLGEHTVAEVNALRVYFIYQKGGGGDDVFIDHVRIGICSGACNYELDLEYKWTAADYDETIEKLCIFAGPQDAEALKVDIWTGSWTNIIADLTYDVWNNVSIASYLTDATVEIRFLGGDETSDLVVSTWEIDAVLIQTYSTAYTEVRYEEVTTDETDYASRGVSKFLFESITIEETDTRISSFSKIFYESVTVDETISFVHDAVRILYESVTTDETISTAAAIISILFESVTLVATGAFNKIIQKFLFESVGVGVTLGLTINISRQFAEGITVSPSLDNTISIVRSFSEGITIDETCYPTIPGGANELYLFESITINETLTTALDASISLFESITINETIDNLFTGEWILHLNESFNYGENDVWGPYRPVIPGAIAPPVTEPGAKRTVKLPFDPLPLLLMIGLVGFGLFYIKDMKPKRLKGSREFLLKGQRMLVRTGRSIKKKVRIKKKKPRKGVVVRKVKRKVPKKATKKK